MVEVFLSKEEFYMSLNIKNPETYRLAKELAEQTGESITTAVTEAVRTRLAEIKRRKRPKGELAAELMRIGKEIASRMTEEERNFDYDAFLYDEETGLPK
jgi:antitoxin VapB